MVLLKNMLGYDWIHLEPTKNSILAEQYCTKTETRQAGPWNQDKKPVASKIPGMLRDWQLQLLNELRDTRDDRKVIWYVDKEGGFGKSTFGIHLDDLSEGYHYFESKFPRKDLLFLLTKEKDIKAIILDIARADHQMFDYGVLEILKNGFFRNAKYEGAKCRFDPPTVIVFANFEPDKTQLSEDRWDIRHLRALKKQKKTDDEFPNHQDIDEDIFEIFD